MHNFNLLISRLTNFSIVSIYFDIKLRWPIWTWKLLGITWLFLWRTFLLLNIFRGKLTTILWVKKLIAVVTSDYKIYVCICSNFYCSNLFHDCLFYTVSHMLEVGKTLLNRDAPQSQQYRYFSCLQLTRAMLIIFVCRVSCEIRLLTHDVGFNCICCP